MKRWVLVATLALATLSLATTAHAQEDGGGPGCGVGAAMWAGKAGQLPQLFAASTNITFLHTVSMTLNLSGCARDGIVLAPHERQLFAAANLPQLLHDMAAGEGLYLQTLAQMMAISPPDQARFYAVSQAQLPHFFKLDDNKTATLLAELDRAVIDARIQSNIEPDIEPEVLP